jgi:hypothetical protein
MVGALLLRVGQNVFAARARIGSRTSQDAQTVGQRDIHVEAGQSADRSVSENADKPPEKHMSVVKHRVRAPTTKTTTKTTRKPKQKTGKP